MKITAFPYVLFRTPYYASNARAINEIFESTSFDEAIYLASLDLYEEKNKKERVNNIEKQKKLELSLNKYATRAMTRCTPFGLFAGCSIATIDEETNLYLADSSAYVRYTRLDMHYMGALVQSLNNNKLVRNQLTYYPNDSIYKFGGKLRYVEYYYKKTKRIHNLSGVELDEYVEYVLDEAKSGKTIKQLAVKLTDNTISLEEALEFIHELIDSQLLKSELELGVTGSDPLFVLIRKLDMLKDIEEIITSLKKIYNLLKKIDASAIGSCIPYYNEITKEIGTIGVDYEQRYLFQADLFKPTIKATISTDIVARITEALNFLNKLSSAPKETNVSKFKDAFYERYEERVVPLVEVLDKELGVGYPVSSGDGEQSPLVNDLILPAINEQSGILINDWGKIMLDKYIAALQNKRTTIELTDNDVKGKKYSWVDMPDTLACMCQIIDEKQIFIGAAEGGATRLLGRFCHLEKNIEKYVKNIAQKEQELNPNTIYAEIVHLPESRIGNILFRPIIREYEIPYLCTPGTDNEHVIPLTDLMISIKNNRIVLLSKRLQKEVVPCLSSAHNYHYNSMPIYRFLCDMYNPIGRNSISFTWGGIDNLFDFLPRVVYKNCVLSKARWLIKKEVLDEWLKLEGNLLIYSVTEYRMQKNIPERITIPDSDNKLFIDFTSALDLQVLLDISRKRNGVIIEEFLFDKDGKVVKSAEGSFCNEFIFTFYKNKE